MLNWFSFGADSSAPKSSDFGLLVTGTGIFNSPSREFTTYNVSGLNGAVIVDEDRYSNVTINYELQLVNASIDNLNAIRRWLCTPSGYQRIYDSYDATTYREGVFTGNLQWTMVNLQKHGKCTVQFNCKPQRFLISGDTEVTLSANVHKSWENDTDFKCYPIIEINNVVTGTLSFTATYTGGGFTIMASALSGTCYIDCQNQTAYTIQNGVRKYFGVRIVKPGTTTDFLGETCIPANTTASVWFNQGSAGHFKGRTWII